MRLWVFDESAIVNYVNVKLPDTEIKNELVQSDLQLTYENLNANFAKGELSLEVRAKQVLRPALDTLSFKQKVAGQKVDVLRTEVLKLAGVERVEVSVWPFWVSRLPENLDKIKLIVE